VNRIDIAQNILDRLGGGTYLEIGVSSGSSFIPMKAKKKWGVDPFYVLTKKRLLKYSVFSALGLKIEKLFRTTSDQFFSRKQKMLARHGITVCLVDGLHTYQQALRDVLNTLPYLKPDGVIVMHDCNPATELVGAPAESINELLKRDLPGWDGSWSGDVWKAVVHLRSLQNDVEAFVLDCDTGVGIVTKRKPKATLGYSEQDIRDMDYHFLEKHRRELLSLQPPEYFEDFITTLGSENGHGGKGQQ
jgi:hypothetical protein